MGLPPHAAHLAGAWATRTAQPTPQQVTTRSRRSRRDRSPRLTVARLLRPLHRPVETVRNDAQSPLTTQPARHA